jgi:mycothiol synthase
MTNIRPFDKEKDYPDAVAISNLLWPEFPVTEEKWRLFDENVPSNLHSGRITAEKSGKLIGSALFGQWEDSYHDQKFWLWIAVHPEHQHEGAGTALLQSLLESIAPYNPIEVITSSHENEVSRMNFLQKHGFVEFWREGESRLDVEAFDPSVLQGTAERVTSLDIVIHTCAELKRDPELDQKVYELHCTICDAMPLVFPFTHLPFEEFKKAYCPEDNDAWFIAIDRSTGKYIGLSALTKPASGDYLYTHLTGTLPEYRGQGIASALKLRTVLYAKEKNVPEIRTTNAQSNKGMLAINEKMGFVRQSARVDFKKEL